MGILRKLFGKYLLLTNTVSCGLMMGFGDALQQRGEHWRRNCLQKCGATDNRNPSAAKSDPKTKNNITLTDIDDNELKYEHDYVRTRNMMTVGVIQGPFHHYFYAMLDRILPGRNTSSVVKKTFIDQMIASPTCLAIFFFGLGALEDRKLQEIHEEVKLKFYDTWKVDCCFWPPTQFINFLFVPVQYRVLYINLMTMLYDMFLSYIKYDAQFD